ncbi:MAG: S-layer homology domain-containing protein [Rhizonema sp. NSF051]|nr:S-layer homology domain-containing protein [Rhizonema sp. NSF051]
MRIYKVAAYTLAAFASSDLGYSACANTPKLTSNHPKPPAEVFASQPFTAATYPKTDLASESQSLLGTKPRQLSGSLTEDFTKTTEQQKQENTITNEKQLKTDRVAQQTLLRHIQGNWAQSFIEPLAALGVIKGFPDGTFRPDAPVTRAQFAAMIQKAFQKNPIRNGVQFVDTPPYYWANGAIQTAYEMGFLEGYPGRIFKPEQKIPRVQVLVSLASGLNLSVNQTTPTVLNAYFQDSSQIPNYAVEQVAAALQNRIVVDYPNVQNLNPNQVATRAEVAAFIYQALVKAGALPELASSQVATQYIVDYRSPENSAPPIAQVEDLRRSFRIPPISPTDLTVVGGIVGVPGSSVASPTAFGAEFGDVFVGGTYQSRARFTNRDDGALEFGFGLGERRIVGLEVAVSSFSTFREGLFTNAGVSLKLHHLFPHNFGIAAGVENIGTFGSPDGGSSVYGVASKIFLLKDDISKPFSALTVSLGVGGGRFRSEYDVQRRIGSTNVFGSVGLRVVEPISVIADWTGQDLTLGTSIAPFRNFPLVITPAVADVTGNAGDGARFILGVGFGYSF